MDEELKAWIILFTVIIGVTVAVGFHGITVPQGFPLPQTGKNDTKIADENTTIKTVWQGPTPLNTSFTAKAVELGKAELDPYSKSVILSTATSTALKKEKYPLDISPDLKTVIKIEKYRCTPDMCGYWITATRNGQEVSTNSPIWISPPPYAVVVSESFDGVKNEQTVTVKESPKEAAILVLQGYVDRQPVGKAIVGTKE